MNNALLSKVIEDVLEGKQKDAKTLYLLKNSSDEIVELFKKVDDGKGIFDVVFEEIPFGVVTIKIPNNIEYNGEKFIDGKAGILKKTIYRDLETGDQVTLLNEIQRIPEPAQSIVSDGVSDVTTSKKEISLIIPKK